MILTRSDIFLLAAAIVLTFLVWTATHYAIRARHVTNSTWDAILGRLRRVDQRNLFLVAEDLRDSGAEQTNTSMDPEGLWAVIGGMEGLATLEANCDVLIELASYVQRWYPEAIVTAEQLRISARQLKWHVDRLRGASQTGNLQASFPDYAQRAVATYYQMTRQVLELYEGLQLPESVRLRNVISPEFMRADA